MPIDDRPPAHADPVTTRASEDDGQQQSAAGAHTAAGIDPVSRLYRSHQHFLDALANLVKSSLDARAVVDDQVLHQDLMQELVRKYVALEKRVSGLLCNTLPASVAEEIQDRGGFAPRECRCTILFADIAGFTRLAERVSGQVLVDTLHQLFTGFDAVIRAHAGTKIKTIGDAYMAVFGAPQPLPDHAVAAIRAGLGLLRHLADLERTARLGLGMRLGIHTGPVMAGVVGQERMQFDVFGDHVNIASRFESAGEKGRINVSAATAAEAAGRFRFSERGLVQLKNKDPMMAYFVDDETLPTPPNEEKQHG